MPTVLNYTASNFSAVYVGFTHIARTRRDNNAFAFFFGAFILAIGSLLIAAPAQAVCPTIVNGETVTNDKQTLLVGQSCTVEKGGKIENDLNSVDPGFLGDGISGNGSNTIINKGKITVEGDNAAGIIVEDDSTVINEGTITASGAGAFAIFIPDDSTVINEGTITASGDAGAGIVGSNLSTGNLIINRGVIAVTGDKTTAVIFFSDSEFINTGLVTTAGADAWAVGFNSGNTITNYGSIMTTDDDEESSAIYTVAGDDNTIINGGLISATGSSAHAIWLRNSNSAAENNEIVLLPGSVIIGSIRLDSDTNTLTVTNGLSVDKTFSDSGALPHINPIGAPMVIKGFRVAVVDPTLSSISDEIITDITNGIYDAVDGRLGQLNSSSLTGTQYAARRLGRLHVSQPSSTGTQSWGYGFGSYREQNGKSPSVDTDHWGTGLVAGADKRFSSGTVVGGFLGASVNMVDHQYNAQQEDIYGYFVGAYGSFKFNNITIGAKITGGITDHDRERVTANNQDMDDGLQTATADYYGFFVAPELSASISLPVTDKITVEPGASLRYTGFFLDGFAESGASDEFVVADRDLHLLQGRIQMAMTIPWAQNSQSYRLVPRLGVEARSIVGGDKVNATLLGENIVFNPGGEDTVVGGFSGLDFNGSINDTVSLYGGMEGLYLDDKSLVLSGGMGVSVAF